MRLENRDKKPRFVILAVGIMLGIFTGQSSQAAQAKKGVKSSFSHEIELGVRAMFQYKLYQGIATPPPMGGAEVSAGIWFKEQASVSIFYDHSIGLEPFFSYGVGLKVPLLGFSMRQGSVFNSSHLFFSLDWMGYSFSSVPAEKIYSSTGSILRWGLSFRLILGDSGFYFNLEMKGVRWNDNLLLAPFLGVGARF